MTTPAAPTREVPCALRAMSRAALITTVHTHGLHVLHARHVSTPQENRKYIAVVKRHNRALYLRSIWHVIGKDDMAIAKPIADNKGFFYPERTPF